jgi:hypothetical protein
VHEVGVRLRVLDVGGKVVYPLVSTGLLQVVVDPPRQEKRK